MHEMLQSIVGQAIVDSGFRRALLNHSAVALSAFDLTAEEREAIDNTRAETMQGFARELDTWICQNALGERAVEAFYPPPSPI